MFKRSPMKQRAKDITLEVRQYGKILPPGSSKNLAAHRKAKVHDKSFDACNKSMCYESNPRPLIALPKRAASRCNSRANKEVSLGNKSTADTRSIIAPSEADRLDIGELIEKAKRELEDNCSHAVAAQKKMNIKENVMEELTETISDNVRRVQIESKETILTKMSEKELRAEISKWREFGYLLAESYEQLKQKYNEQIITEAKSRQVMDALKEQVSKLKALLNHSSAENRALREELESQDSTSVFAAELKRKNEDLADENRTLRREKETLEKSLIAKCQEKEILENEKALNNKLVQQLNEKIKKLKSELTTLKMEQKVQTQESFTEEGTDRQTEFFKKMSAKNLEQCGTLAEQLICLRNDLDRSHFDILRIQRQRSSSLSSCQSCSPGFGLRKSESDFELLKPQAPPKPTKMEARTTAGHSRVDSRDTNIYQSQREEDEVNRSFVISRPNATKSKKMLGMSMEQYKTVPSNKLLPPRAPLVAHYHSNNKNFGSVIRKAKVKS